MFTRKLTIVIAAAFTAAALGACSQPASSSAPGSDGAASPSLSTATTLTVVTHDSFNLPDELKDRFAQESGLQVTYVAPGDAGALVNQLILTKDSPLGDVVFGIDNSFSSRAVDAGIIADYDSPALPPTSSQFDVAALTPIDFGDVCLNVDRRWFEDKGLTMPTGLADLVKPEYKDLLVVTNPASSSPGLAFLMSTIAAKGEDGYLDYWGQLVDNGVSVVQSWSDAYYTEFSGADGKGPRPIVLSYATSPAYTLSEDGSESTTVALLGTCFRQVEYAGVIKGGKNEKGAQEFIDFLLSDAVQASIPENMYMYPVTNVALPEQWEKFAPLSNNSLSLAPDEISANRDTWIKAWTAKVIG